MFNLISLVLLHASGLYGGSVVVVVVVVVVIFPTVLLILVEDVVVFVELSTAVVPVTNAVVTVVLEGIVVVVPVVWVKNSEKTIVNRKILSQYGIMSVKMEVVYGEYNTNIQVNVKIVVVIGSRQKRL